MKKIIMLEVTIDHPAKKHHLGIRNRFF